MSAATGGVGSATSYVVVGNSTGTSVGGRPNNHVVVGAANTSPFAGGLRAGPGTLIEQYVF